MSTLPVLYGITHSPVDKQFIARVPRSIKVAIGNPRGPAIHVSLVDNKDRTKLVWMLEIGVGKQIEKRWYQLSDRAALERDMADLRAKVPERAYPGKLPYFSFYKDRGDGILIHDLDAILLHGRQPTAIDIMFTDSAPFRGQYEWWGKKGLVCKGDGLEAMRIVGDPKTPGKVLDKLNPERRAKQAETDAAYATAADEAAAAGFTHFALDGCYLRGCPLAGGDCKPHGYLSFQLLQDLRIGSKAEIATTSIASISQLSASLKELEVFTGEGNLRGLPLTLTLRPFRTNHNNQPGVAYKMAVEFRAGTVETMKQKVIAAHEMMTGFKHKEVKQIEAGAKQIAAAAEVIDAETLEVVEGAEDINDVDEGVQASQNSVFFDGEAEGAEEDPATEEAEKETAAQAGASEMAETEARLKAAHEARMAKQAAEKPAEEPAPEQEEPKEVPPPTDAPPPTSGKRPLFGKRGNN